jgi:hypothetical protein
VHDGILGEASRNTPGIVGIGRREVLGKGLWQLHGHGSTPLHLANRKADPYRQHGMNG